MSKSKSDEKVSGTATRKNSPPTHIVGIGASAGGLEPLQALFDSLPNDLNIAYVVIQHLSPDFKSMMEQLLTKNTRMPTHQAVEGELIRPNVVYLIPAGKLLRIAEGKIYLSDPPPDNRINLPIDDFFRSLAEDNQNRAIGIILSGTGSDGSRGIQSLKEVGAMIIAQDPDEAQFDGMPLNAINTGSVDFILPIDRMAEQIKRFVQHPFVTKDAESIGDHIEENTEVLDRILKLVDEKTDLDFSLYKSTTIIRRIEHRISIRNKRSIQEYWDYMQLNPDEIQMIKQDLLIGVTQFFRDGQVWDSVNERVVYPLIKSVREDVLKDSIRIWCAGCSTGEEAYSIAMLFAEALENLEEEGKLKVKVFASDVDQTAVAYAANGVYPASISSEVSQEYLKKYFNQLPDGSFQVNKFLRSMVVFATQNLIQDPPFSNMDFVSCRNTLIYLQSAAQKKLLGLFNFALKIDGYMLLGLAETKTDLDNYFDSVDVHARIYQKMKDLKVSLSNLGSVDMRKKSMPRQQSSLHQYLAKTDMRGRSSRKDVDVAKEGLLNEFIPPTVVFDNHLDLVYSYGDTERFTRKIKPGPVSYQLVDMLISEVANTAMSAVHEVFSGKKSVLYENAYPEKFDDKVVFWSIKAIPVREGDDLENQQMSVALSFIRDSSLTISKAQRNYSISQLDAHKVDQLNHALIECQDLYRETLENLDTTSEELQSSNEELMAANEELQSTNEELQSVNEELYTVNTEFQQKISELSAINIDLETLLKATNMAVIFLDRNLRIRRFTDAMKDFVNIIDYDINRQFSDLSLNMPLPDLHDFINKANRSGEPTIHNYEVNGEEIEIEVLPYAHQRVMAGTVVCFKKVLPFELEGSNGLQ